MSPEGESDDVKSPEKEENLAKSEEQQMADWEEALKNDDWGHQPC